jgi:hypothetical protein
MHNCKQVQRHFVDLVLHEPTGQSAQLLEELNRCSACRAEFAALTGALHVSHQALKATLPGEDFWAAYDAKLKAKLAAARPHEDAPAASNGAWTFLKSLASSSIRLPVPAAVAAVLLLGGLFAVLFKRAQANVAAPPTVVVETKTVEVPVVQEKTITRVAYATRRERAARPVNVDHSNTRLPDTVAKAARPLSLNGFKPTSEIKMTIIKGTYQDEK